MYLHKVFLYIDKKYILKIMSIIKLFEDYVNSPSNMVSTLLNNMVNMFKDTFEGKNDVLGEKELDVLTLVDIERSISQDISEKNLILNFTDGEYYYQVIFIIKISDVKKSIDKGYMKIKIYDNENNEKIREWQGDLAIKIATDEEINKEGRFFVKVKLNSEVDMSKGQNVQAQATSTQGQTQTAENFKYRKWNKIFEANDSGYEYIELFIIFKIGELKTQFE